MDEVYPSHLDTLDAGHALGTPHGVSAVVTTVIVLRSPHPRHLVTPPQAWQCCQSPTMGQLVIAGAGAAVVQDMFQAARLAMLSQHVRPGQTSKYYL